MEDNSGTGIGYYVVVFDEEEGEVECFAKVLSLRSGRDHGHLFLVD